MTSKDKKPLWQRLLSNRRTVQTAALFFSNASFLTFLRFIPCGYLQCSNCAISTFSCPLILLQRGAVMASMGMLGGLDSKFTASATAAVAMLVFFGALFGSFGCGWLCPFGFLQDLLGKIPLKKITLPGWAGLLRLPLFAGLVVIIPYLSRQLIFCDLCPSGAINRLWQEAAGIPLFFRAPEGFLALASLMFLASILLGAIFIHRPFCTLFCPIGGFVGLCNKISGLHLTRNHEKCVACNRCRDACPQGIDPVRDPAHSQCSRCLECSARCRLLNAEFRT